MGALVTTLTVPERLAVLEAKGATLQGDVTEIKSDVKEIARAQASMATELATKTAAIAADLATKTASLATNLAVKQSADSATGLARASTGVWVRAIVPWFIAGVGTMAGGFAATGVIHR